jgi:hypothetical protein
MKPATRITVVIVACIPFFLLLCIGVYVLIQTVEKGRPEPADLYVEINVKGDYVCTHVQYRQEKDFKVECRSFADFGLFHAGPRE